MTSLPQIEPLTGSAGLLERAIGYALDAVQRVTPHALTGRTPCRAWNLRMLLLHLNDSMAALHEGLVTGVVGPEVTEPAGETAADLKARFRDRAGDLLGALGAVERPSDMIFIVDRSLTGDMTVGTGAIEIATHGWDVARACVRRPQIPPRLATELLELSHLVITAENRHPFFAPPVAVAHDASPSDRLVAFLGRHPTG